MDTVTHDGRQYRLADLAHYMDYDQREAVHASPAADGDPQHFWNEFARRFPAEADHLAEITPPRGQIRE